jgi:CRISPR/Cas system-associated endonuclease Cas1
LVNETNDGTLIDRYMTTVRRVTVENGQVVVVGKDGKIQRIPLANVVRMTIAP